jgi:nucleotide-binding universal stress UspA family protein
MAPSVTVSGVGIFLALVFMVSMGGLLWWMLHVPRAVPEVAARVWRSVGAIRTILVPVMGTDYSNRGIELACRIGLEQKAEILLTYVVEIPLSLPLDAPMPEEDRKGREILERSKSIVEVHGLPTRIRMVRARNAADKLAQIVKDEDLQLIVMGIRPRAWAIENLIGRTSEAILRKLPCEVIINAFPESQAS